MGRPASPVGPIATLVRRRLDVALPPEEVVLALRGDRLPFALVGSWAGGGAVVGSEPVAVLAGAGDPFDALDHVPRVGGGTPVPSTSGGGAGPGAAGSVVGGGWFGWLGYQLASHLERLPPAPPRPSPLPPAHLAFYDHLLRLDGASGTWWFEALWTPERAGVLERRAADLTGRLAAVRPGEGRRRWRLGPFAVVPPRHAHQAAVRACLDHIRAGDVFQANLCLRLDAPFAGDPLDVFTAAAGRLRPRYGAVFPTPGGGVATFSPELFLRRVGAEVRTSPIKGTAPRTGGPGDASRRQALLASAKDRAEHVMIVDLMRNDLGRVSSWGSVHVPHLVRPEAHPGVWHLVSDVSGLLRPRVGDAALLRATFPPGSVTGAPKVRAMELIAGLEATAREAYTGCIGYASPLAGLELAVTIRTLEWAGGRMWLGAGGGIVAASRPDHELEECLVKARPLVAAAGSTIHADQADSDQGDCDQGEGVKSRRSAGDWPE